MGVSIFVSVACSNETINPGGQRVGFAHFPLEIGLFREYEVEDINLLFNGQNDTSNFLLRELIVDSVDNDDGTINYTLHQFSRQDTTQTWSLDSVWTTRRTAIQGIVVENNTPFVKLVFPVDENKTWDGNVLNTKEFDEYQMVNVFREFVIDSLESISFGNTITVIQNDFRDNITMIDVRTEVYAENIGLVYKNIEILQFCADPDCVGLEIVEVGRKLKQKIIDFGKE
ncbi:MAG: hypothetical protein O6939_08405 [Bacteroidetes bacterium]|nr:hypothetical protein [Bacteroidota bacterium]